MLDRKDILAFLIWFVFLGLVAYGLAQLTAGHSPGGPATATPTATATATFTPVPTPTVTPAPTRKPQGTPVPAVLRAAPGERVPAPGRPAALGTSGAPRASYF